MLKGKNINYKTGRKQQDDQVPNIQTHSLNKYIIRIKKKSSNQDCLIYKSTAIAQNLYKGRDDTFDYIMV